MRQSIDDQSSLPIINIDYQHGKWNVLTAFEIQERLLVTIDAFDFNPWLYDWCASINFDYLFDLSNPVHV